MPSANQVIELGNLTRDPDLTYTQNQTPVCVFGLAVNSKWTGSDGQAKEEVMYIEVRTFGKLADNCNKYLSKGSLVLVLGKLIFESWKNEDRDYQRHGIVAKNVQFLSMTGRPTIRQRAGASKAAKEIRHVK